MADRNDLSRCGCVGVLVCLLVALLAGADPPARAAPLFNLVFTVNDTADVVAAAPLTDGICDIPAGAGLCTLRAAIMKANHYNFGSVTINLPALPPGGSYLLTIAPTGSDDEKTGDLNVIASIGRPSLTIAGGGAANTVINASGMVPGDRVLSIAVGASVTISGVTFEGGQRLGVAGGINNAGTLTLNNSTVISNTTDGDGGGILNEGMLALNGSTVTGNTAGASSGGIYNQNSLSLNGSTLSNNHANNGGGIRNDKATMSVTNSAFANNTAHLGGGLYNFCATATIINSTVSGNQSGTDGGGIANTSGCGATLSVYNLTVADNQAAVSGPGTGGGIANPPGATFNLVNTILDGNGEGTGHFALASDCSGTLISQGYNLISNMLNCTLTGSSTGVITGTAALLGPLRNNGGPTFTNALLPGSPAIDAGNPAGCADNLGATLHTDQRGAPRPANGAGSTRCDIGAFELQRALELPLVLK